MGATAEPQAEEWDAQRIKTLRLRLGYSQEEFAPLIGVHRVHLAHLERGARRLRRWATVRRLRELEQGADCTPTAHDTESGKGYGDKG